MQNTLPIIGILAASFLVGSCANYDSSVKVSDVRKEEVVVLKYQNDSTHVTGINIRVTGKVNGGATISLMLDGKPYKKEELNGGVNIKWGGDWYSDTAELRYIPRKVNSGELLIEYKFSTL